MTQAGLGSVRTPKDWHHRAPDGVPSEQPPCRRQTRILQIFFYMTPHLVERDRDLLDADERSGKKLNSIFRTLRHRNRCILAQLQHGGYSCAIRVGFSR
jgi:hypothetical protein